MEQNLSKNVSLHLTQEQQGVVHTAALPFYIKKYLKANLEELWKTQIFHHANIYQSSKESSKKTHKSFKIL